MTLTEALILARGEGGWIRPVADGEVFSTRWLRRAPGGSLDSLSYVWTDRSVSENRAFIAPTMGTIDRLIGEWEAVPDPVKKPARRRERDGG